MELKNFNERGDCPWNKTNFIGGDWCVVVGSLTFSIQDKFRVRDMEETATDI